MFKHLIPFFGNNHILKQRGPFLELNWNFTPFVNLCELYRNCENGLHVPRKVMGNPTGFAKFSRLQWNFWGFLGSFGDFLGGRPQTDILRVNPNLQHDSSILFVEILRVSDFT